MSRSCRKKPFIPMTTAKSEKKYKQAAHRAFRRASKAVLGRGQLPHEKEYGDPWKGDKDGKQRIDPRKLRKYMRK